MFALSSILFSRVLGATVKPSISVIELSIQLIVIEMSSSNKNSLSSLIGQNVTFNIFMVLSLLVKRLGVSLNHIANILNQYHTTKGIA